MTVESIVKIIAERQNKSNDLVYQEVLKEQIIAFNSVLIKQNHDKVGFVNQLYVQTIKGISLTKIEDVDLNEHYFITKTLPKVLPFRDKPFVSVSNKLGSVKRVGISYLLPEELQYVRYRRFTKNKLYYTWQDNKISIHNIYDIESINIRGVFDNPYKVLDFGNQCGCETESSCFDINGEMEITEYNSGLILTNFIGNYVNTDEK